MQRIARHLKNLILITGSAKSGKSELAEKIAGDSKGPVFYLATMPILDEDPELLYKIETHRKRRPESWQTIEEETGIENAIDGLNNQASTCIIDCLSLYVSNIMLSETLENEKAWFEEVNKQIDELLACIGRNEKIFFLVVSNEVGWSVVPDNKQARLYRDLLGIANQKTASQADQVYLCVSGVTVKIKADNIDLFGYNKPGV